MQILSDMLQKEHVLITVSTEATSFEILRAILLYKELEAKSLKPLFYIHGTPTPFLSAAINAEGIRVQERIVKDTPFVIEIKGGSNRIKSVKVDKVGDKLKLFLIPNKGVIQRDVIDVVGVNLPYSHIIGFGKPSYLDELFEGVSYEKLSAIKEYGRKEFTTVSLEDFADIIAHAHQMSLSKYVERLIDLEVYNNFIEFFLTGGGNVDLLKVREALINNVLSWGRKDYVQALANWRKENDFIVGIVRVEEQSFVPSMPMWADFVFLAETGIRYPVVTLVQFGKYLYTRIVSPKSLPAELQHVGFWVKDRLAESLVIATQVEEWKNKIIALLRKAGIKAEKVKEEMSSTAVLNTAQTAYDALQEFKIKSEDNSIEPKGTVVWSQESSKITDTQSTEEKVNVSSLSQPVASVKAEEYVDQEKTPSPSSEKAHLVAPGSVPTGDDNRIKREEGVNSEPEGKSKIASRDKEAFNGVNVQVSDEPLELGDLVAKLAASVKKDVQDNAENETIKEPKQDQSSNSVSQDKHIEQQNPMAQQLEQNVDDQKKVDTQGNTTEATDSELEELAAKIRKTLDL